MGVRESTPKHADKVILVRGRDDAHTNTPTRLLFRDESDRHKKGRKWWVLEIVNSNICKDMPTR